MSNNQVVIDTLIKKREQFIAEKRVAMEQYDASINEIENAIEVLAGKKVWDKGALVLYDDENQNYIKASQEEI